MEACFMQLEDNKAMKQPAVNTISVSVAKSIYCLY